MDTLEQLLKAYSRGTMLYSFAHGMRRDPNHAKIVGLGKEAIPGILRYLVKHWGMSTQLLLHDITGESPVADAQEEVAPGFIGTRVEDAANLWLSWGHQRGYLNKGDPRKVEPEAAGYFR